MKSVSTFLFSLIMLLVVTTAKSSERGLFKRQQIFPPISPTFPIPITTTSTTPPAPSPPAPTPPSPPIPPPPIPTASTPTVTVTILSTSFLPEVTPTPPAPQETSNFSTYVPSTTVEVIQTVAPAPNPTDSDSDSDSDYEGNGNSLIVEGIGIKMSIAAVFLNVFYVLFA